MYRSRNSESVSFVLFAAAAIVVLGAIMRGFVLKKLWGWFVIPLFPSAPAVSIAQAIGISLVVGYLTHQDSESKSESSASSAKGVMAFALLGLFIQSAIVFLFGWVTHLFT